MYHSDVDVQVNSASKSCRGARHADSLAVSEKNVRPKSTVIAPATAIAPERPVCEALRWIANTRKVIHVMIGTAAVTPRGPRIHSSAVVLGSPRRMQTNPNRPFDL